MWQLMFTYCIFITGLHYDPFFTSDIEHLLYSVQENSLVQLFMK